MPGVIVPRKAVAEIQKLLEDGENEVAVELSGSKIRVATADVVLTSKLIDGTFPDYQRVIPSGNDKRLTVDRGDFAASVDRVSTISSERCNAPAPVRRSSFRSMRMPKRESASCASSLHPCARPHRKHDAETDRGVSRPDARP